jgi:hypothetical protein
MRCGKCEGGRGPRISARSLSSAHPHSSPPNPREAPAAARGRASSSLLPTRLGSADPWRGGGTTAARRSLGSGGGRRKRTRRGWSGQRAKRAPSLLPCSPRLRGSMARGRDDGGTEELGERRWPAEAHVARMERAAGETRPLPQARRGGGGRLASSPCARRGRPASVQQLHRARSRRRARLRRGSPPGSILLPRSVRLPFRRCLLAPLSTPAYSSASTPAVRWRATSFVQPYMWASLRKHLPFPHPQPGAAGVSLNESARLLP